MNVYFGEYRIFFQLNGKYYEIEYLSENAKHGGILKPNLINQRSFHQKRMCIIVIVGQRFSPRHFPVLTHTKSFTEATTYT